jgi:hypothetical protein
VADTSACTIAVTGVLEGGPIAKPATGSRAVDVDSTDLHASRLMMFETRWSASQTRYAAD